MSSKRILPKTQSTQQNSMASISMTISEMANCLKADRSGGYDIPGPGRGDPGKVGTPTSDHRQVQLDGSEEFKQFVDDLWDGDDNIHNE